MIAVRFLKPLRTLKPSSVPWVPVRIDPAGMPSGRMSKKNTLTKLKAQERQVRRDLIIDAAQRIFGTKTYDRTSMREIAEEAGIAASTIYTYFPNQETLFVEAMVRDTGGLIDELEQMLTEEGDIDIERFMNRYLDFYIDHETHWRMITHFFLFGQIGSASSARLNEVARRLLGIFDRIFAQMNYDGDVRLLSHTFFSALSGILISFRKYPGRDDEQVRAHMKRIGRMVRDMLMAYIAAEEKAAAPAP
jgi:AcrR family transcriptional regulator